MTRSSDEDLDRYAREATDREMERRLQRLQRQTAPIQKRDAPAPAGIYFPPHVERRRRLFYAELAQAGIVSGWGSRPVGMSRPIAARVEMAKAWT